VAGKLRSGCIPVSPKALRPTPDTVASQFAEAVAATGFGDVFAQNVVISARDEGSARSRRPMTWHDDKTPWFLYTCMEDATPVALSIVEPFEPDFMRAFKMMIRFPNMWADGNATPILLERPLLER